MARAGRCFEAQVHRSPHTLTLVHSTPSITYPASYSVAHQARGSLQACSAERAPAISPFAPPEPAPPPLPPSQAVPVREKLSGESQAAWDQAVEQLTQKLEGGEPDKIQKAMERAFGWGTQAFWRGSKVEEVPAPGQVSAVLAYLEGLGISGQDLAKVIKVFPEVLACSVDGQLEAVVARLQNEWKLTGDVLKRAMVRRPEISSEYAK